MTAGKNEGYEERKSEFLHILFKLSSLRAVLALPFDRRRASTRETTRCGLFRDQRRPRGAFLVFWRFSPVRVTDARAARRRFFFFFLVFFFFFFSPLLLLRLPLVRRHLLVEEVGDVRAVVARLHHDLPGREHRFRVIN